MALLCAGSFFVIWLGRVELEKEPIRYTIYFDGAVTGLQVGSAVRYRGVPVGSVSEILIDPGNIERIRVMIEVTEGTPVKSETVATLGIQGITGLAFIQLSGGQHDSPNLAPQTKDRTASIPSQSSGLEEVLEKAPELFSKAIIVADRLSQLVDNKNLSAVRDTLSNIQNITSVLADRSKNLDRILVDAGGTLTAFRDAARSVEQLSDQLKRDVKPTSRDARLAMRDLRVALKEAKSALSSISSVSRELKKMVVDNRQPLKDFSSGGLYELSQFIAEARVLVAGLTRLSGQIEREPARFFFGDTQKGFEAK